MQSTAGESDAIRQEPGSAAASVKSSRRISPSQLLHLFCAGTAVLWMVLLAVTFTDTLLLILLASGLWILAASLSVVLGCYLAKRQRSSIAGTPTPSRRSTPMMVTTIILAWTVGTLVISNFVVDYGQSRQRLWTAFVFDARYGWYPEPHLQKRRLLTPHGSYLATTDELGHRNSVPYPVDGLLPIIIQGDSNAFGFGLSDDETLAAKLNARLKGAQVFNLGVPGFDLNHYYYQYEDLSRRFKMGRRIILWNIGNDFTLSALETPNYFRRPYLYVENGAVKKAADFQAPFPVQGYGQSFLPPYRKFDSLVNEPAYDWADVYSPVLIRTPLSRQLIRTYHPKLVKAIELLRPRQLQLELYDPSWMLLKRELWPAPFDQYARDFPLLLRALKQQNPHSILCPFPFREQVIPAEYAARKENLAASGHRPDDFDPLAFNKFLKDVCDAEGIRLVDPTREFLNATAPLMLYQQGDQHLSAEGMERCAQALRDAGLNLSD